MTTFLLIRHGAHLAGPEVIAGRSSGVHLSPLGRQQALALAARLEKLPIRAIYSSPIDRAKETAQPISEMLHLPVQIRENLAEIDFGRWTGMKIDDIRADPVWKQWNAFRSGTRIPGGEIMPEVQARIVREMEQLSLKHPDDCVALVSHGDVIKSAVAYFAGVPLDLFQRIEIGLVSVSVIAVGQFGPWVLCVNNTAEVQMPY